MAGKDYGVVIITPRSGPLAGQKISAMGEIKIKATGYKVGAETSVDQQVLNRSFEPTPVVVSCDFDRGDIDWDALLRARFDMTWEEVHAALNHYMTNAGLVGEAQESFKDGKLTGLEIQCTKLNYRRRAV
ncbi:hypothetical protein [Bosea sp. (in: a-proteobacteria)]|uniref:hypothetical protein n=1 Tax=Bosea sp. (in: a-proteobacteria) TaxID=1871050 RepID=UPI003B3AE9CC